MSLKSHFYYILKDLKAVNLAYKFQNSLIIFVADNSIVISFPNQSTEIIKKYAKVGAELQRNSSIILRNLEDVLKNKEKSSILLKEAEGFEDEYKGQYNLTLNESYIALAAPSLTGKTQTAFTLKSKIPLYLVFDSKQNIYLPFQTLAISFEDCAFQDIPIMRQHLTSFGRSIEYGFPYINRSDFHRLLTVKSKVIGLLIALMEDSELFVSTGKPEDWFMHFSRSRQIDFTPATIGDFKMHPLSDTFIKKYYVFMDEFNGSSTIVFLRNLFRYLEISCILASTNAKVVNLIGISPQLSSRIDGPRAWSLVFPKLDSITESTIENNSEFFHYMNSAIQKASEISEMNGLKMRSFFEYVREQCLFSRPGFALLTMDVALEIIKKGDFNVDSVFETFLLKIRSQLASRKPQAFNTNAASWANFFIMVSGLFNKSRHTEQKSLGDFKNSDPIDKHFYYLCSPKGDSNLPFLLSRHVDTSIEECNESNILVYDPSFKKFNINSYFDINETLLMLTCLYSGSRTPVNTLISQSVKLKGSDNYNSEALKRSGDLEENLALVSICDASHKNIKGTGLIQFFRGVLWNLNPKRPYADFDVEIPDPLICKSLENIKVPFLLPSTIKMSVSFDKMFPLGHSTIHFGAYSMTSNSKQVDAVFDLVPTKGESSKVQCIVEAKNREAKFSNSEFLKIIEKGLLYSNRSHNLGIKFPLHLTITSTLKKFNSSNDKSIVRLKELAFEHQINFLSLNVAGKDNSAVKIELVPILKELPLFPDPKMTSIVIDNESLIAAINNR